MSFTRKVKRLLRHIGHQVWRGTLPFRQSGFSCINEEQMLNRYIAELLPADHCRTAVDVGAGDGRTSSNTLGLFKRGWKGLGIDCDNRKAYKLGKAYQHLPEVSVCCLRVTPSNIIPLLEAYAVERNFGVLNLDIDSYDYWVLDAILRRYRPGIVITEINEKVPPPIKFRVKYDPHFQSRSHFYGYSIQCLEDLCAQHGYALIDLECNNAFLAPTEIACARALTPESAYRQGYLERADRRERFHRNEDMEVLQSLSPEDGMDFVRQFFPELASKYELSIAGAPKDGLAQNKMGPAPPNKSSDAV